MSRFKCTFLITKMHILVNLTLSIKLKEKFAYHTSVKYKGRYPLNKNFRDMWRGYPIIMGFSNSKWFYVIKIESHCTMQTRSWYYNLVIAKILVYNILICFCRFSFALTVYFDALGKSLIVPSTFSPTPKLRSSLHLSIMTSTASWCNVSPTIDPCGC